MQQPRHQPSRTTRCSGGIVWSSAALLCTSLPAGALSIGEPHSVSHLAEPLSFSVDIDRAGARIQDIYVRPVSTADRRPDPTELTMRVDPLPGDRLRLTVEGNRPHLEPILSFEIEVRSGAQRIAKEVSVLADVRPQASLFRQNPLVERAGETTLHLSLPGQPSSAPAPALPTDQGRLAAIASPGIAFGPVTAGDTVSMIAQRTRPSPAMPLQQAIRALLEANPDLRGDPTRLRAGQMLRLPTGFQPAQQVATQPATARPHVPAGSIAPSTRVSRFQLSEQLNPVFMAAIQPTAPTRSRLRIDLSELLRDEATPAATVEASPVDTARSAAPPPQVTAAEVSDPSATPPLAATVTAAPAADAKRGWPDWLFYALINGICAAVALALLMRPKRVRDDALAPRPSKAATRVATTTRDLDAANEEPPELAADVISRRSRKAGIDDRKLLGADKEAARPIRRRIMKLRGRAAPENKVEIARLMYLAEAYLETDQFELAERLVAEAEGRSDGRQHRPGAAA